MAELIELGRKALHWWLRELAQLLPARLRAAWGRGRQALTVTLDASALVLAARKPGESIALGALELGAEPRAQRAQLKGMLATARLRDAEVVLVLPRAKALRKVIELPAAAAENLKEVISFELDRHTPFQAADVYFDGRIMGASARPGRLDVDLAVAPKGSVEPALVTLRELGIPPDRLIVQGDEDEAMNLMPASAGAVARSLSGRLSFGLGAVAIALLLLTAFLPLWRMQDRLRAIEDQVTRARLAAVEADTLRKQIDATLRLNEFLTKRKNERPTVTELLDEVTRLLPDNTWLAQLTLRDRTLALTGTSARAAALIAELEKSRLLSGVSFSAPVTQDPRQAGERFNLSATVTNEKPR